MGVSTSVDVGAVVVVAVVGGSEGGGVEGLWPKRDANVDRRADEDACAPRAPGRGGRGGLVAREGSGSVGLNPETVHEG